MNKTPAEIPGHASNGMIPRDLPAFAARLAEHQPKILNVGVLLYGAAVIAMPCAGCDFAAHVPSGADNIETHLREQFAQHQADMIAPLI